MPQPLRDAVAMCKTINRNGFDAYVINAGLQKSVLENDQEQEVELATDIPFPDLQRLFPHAVPGRQEGQVGEIHEGGALFRFYAADVETASHIDVAMVKLTPRLRNKLQERGELPANLACPLFYGTVESDEGFAGWDGGEIRLRGLPDETLRSNFLLAIRALRFAVNFNLPIEANTWMAIVRHARDVVDYVPVYDIMDEWRKVEAENMWHFVQLLCDSQILHGLIPEVSALSRVRQIKNDSGQEETVFDHTIQVMRYYTEQLPYDWFGTMACLLHDVGKLHTVEYANDRWLFHQHPHVGAKLARLVLRRLELCPEDIDLIVHLVRHHKRFDPMLTERGIRRFKALDEYPRIMEMARANIKARDGSTKAFNHNIKYLERADIPEEMTEPLLNGNEIMDFTGLQPGPVVGVIREALLKAQIEGRVNSIPEAVDFVLSYQEKEGLVARKGEKT
ncbi:MAG: HD domain-containing protein [Desulfovermiculus sp.]